MKENSIEEDIAKVNTYIELVLEKDYCNCNELNIILGKHCDGSKNVAYAIEHILSDYKRVLKENEELKEYNIDYKRILDLADNRTYRKKYLEERRKEQPNLLYPDGDEIYQRYYELQKEIKNLTQQRDYYKARYDVFIV